jgi:purine-binding chemotaxis protein CheW
MSTQHSRQGKPAAIDWLEVRQRVETTRAAFEHGWAPDPEETRRILKARAHILAQEPEKAEAAAVLEFVEFFLAHEKYAVESRFVREVCPLESLTPLPCTPAFVLGIVSVRGEILSVLDIKKFFDLPEKGLTDLNKVIILKSGNMQFGILADVIVGVCRISVSDVQPSLPALTGTRERYLMGVSSERVVLLDAAKLLADQAIIVQEQV